MKKSQRLQVIIDLHERQERDALEAMGRIQNKLQQAQQQLQNLNRYRDEYNTKLLQHQQRGMNVLQLLEFRAFAEKLDKAIESQQQSLSLVERELQRAQKHWEECHQRTKSLQRLAEIAADEERRLESKREQAEQDARAGRQNRRDGTRNA